MASSNMLLFLREELTSLPKMVRTAFCLPSRSPAQRVPCTLSGVCGSGQTMHTRRFRGYVHECAIFGRCHTRHCAFRSTRGRWWVRGLRALSTVPRCKLLFWVQRDPGMRLGLPKARVRNAFTCAATPGPYMAWHGAWWARGGSLKHVCARYERCHCEHHIWLQRARGTLLAWPKHACGAFLRACAWARYSGPVQRSIWCILMSERLLARPRDARALGGAVCCEHVL